MGMRNLLPRSLVGLFVLLASVSALAPAARGDEFPTKPLTLIVPVGAGGSHDLTARAVTSVATTYLGQPIIVQLKPGGGGAIGSEMVAKARPRRLHPAVRRPGVEHHLSRRRRPFQGTGRSDSRLPDQLRADDHRRPSRSAVQESQGNGGIRQGQSR